METLKEVCAEILAEVTSDNAEVRANFLDNFRDEVKIFSNAMGGAFMKWRSLDNGSRGSEKRAYISALIYTAINLHVLSMKHFLSGHVIAAGNATRQVVEAICLAILCSEKDSEVLDRFMKGEYSSNNAVRDVLRHFERLGVRDDGVEALKQSQKFYHKYSHITHLTIATHLSFSENTLHVGAFYDEGKVDAYYKEMNGRVSLAMILPNIVDGVRAKVETWEDT